METIKKISDEELEITTTHIMKKKNLEMQKADFTMQKEDISKEEQKIDVMLAEFDK